MCFSKSSTIHTLVSLPNPFPTIHVRSLLCRDLEISFLLNVGDIRTSLLVGEKKDKQALASLLPATLLAQQDQCLLDNSQWAQTWNTHEKSPQWCLCFERSIQEQGMSFTTARCTWSEARGTRRPRKGPGWKHCHGKVMGESWALRKDIQRHQAQQWLRASCRNQILYLWKLRERTSAWPCALTPVLTPQTQSTALVHSVRKLPFCWRPFSTMFPWPGTFSFFLAIHTLVRGAPLLSGEG